MADLTAARVGELLEKCLYQDGEPADQRVEVEGILHKFVLHRDRLQANANAIQALLAELPEQFRRSGGSGWSFLNACMDRHGSQWTGLHLVMEQLFALGMGIGKAEYVLPRELWDVAFPGGMPYLVLDM